MPPVRRQLMPVALFCPQKHLAICPKRVNLDDLREWSPLATAHQEAATKSPLDVEWAGSVWVEFGPSSFEYNFVRYSLNEQDWSGRIL